MGKVKIEIVPWLNQLFGERGSRRLFLEEEVSQEVSLRDVILAMIEKYPPARESVFDSQTGGLQEHISIIYNDTMLSSDEALQQRIEDGDTIVLLPSFVGG